MEIKIAIENDSKEISKLMLELGYNSSIKLLCEKIQEFEQSTTDQVFVAIKDNEIVGCVSCHLTLLFHKPGSAGRITSLVVAEKARNQGIGSKLVQSADIYFKENGCRSSELTSGDHRTEAHTFYQKHGYKQKNKRFIKYLSC